MSATSPSAASSAAVLSEFEPTRGPVGLPPYETRVPEAMNNYNLPSNPVLITEKVQRLGEQFPTFANKSADDLEDLLRFEDLFQAHIDGLEQVQLMRTLEYELREENERLAEVNLSSEDELRRMRDNVAELQMFASSMTSRLYELVQEHLDLQKPYSPMLLLQRLRDEVKALDEQAEAVARGFMAKDEVIESSECEDFVRMYKQLRLRFHSSESRCRLADAAYRSGSLSGVPLSLDR
ncbi:hypothetical protein GGH94_006377 [Coemansia aciculifera]|uniref:VPS37 C-terminal domain-containing protein n=2 Tax=Coemansia TaxID=4863 RepID=A0A9W8GPL0_9FUNG|nr:hypothetical protein GGI17_006626 [Coemansia sp. S146]KAJ2749240.1 hypothetical protein GGI19_005756 [Coemansia pectinata]KAJ2858914.1 hypothetical protein GGH94_006377 [Coemansia aciculifera]KAJ2879357.1 hypothetical protein H4R27_005360 [Coemansia aciculifera]